MEEPPESQPTIHPVRRITWLLLLLLAAVGLFAGTDRFSSEAPTAPGVPAHVAMPDTPPPVAATGRMAKVFQAGRTGTVKIESRCSPPVFGSRPIDIGSGFFVSEEGLLLTAYHVVRRQTLDASRCRLEYFAIDAEQREYELELMAFDAYLDLALMKAKTDQSVEYLQLAASPPKVGDPVVAIGNSRGEFLADRAGTVTRLGVRASAPDFATGTVELTAALAPGDSGGPVLGRGGRVLGVVSYISFDPGVMVAEGDTPLASWFGKQETPDFASYAVPVLADSDVLGALAAGHSRDVPVIGFELAFEYDPADPDSPWLGRRPGVVVGRVQPDGPGAQAGLRSPRDNRVIDADGRVVGRSLEADVIVSVDGRPTPSFRRLVELVRQKPVGERVALTIQRGADTHEMTLELAGFRQVFR